MLSHSLRALVESPDGIHKGTQIFWCTKVFRGQEVITDTMATESALIWGGTTTEPKEQGNKNPNSNNKWCWETKDRVYLYPPMH